MNGMKKYLFIAIALMLFSACDKVSDSENNAAQLAVFDLKGNVKECDMTLFGWPVSFDRDGFVSSDESDMTVTIVEDYEIKTEWDYTFIPYAEFTRPLTVRSEQRHDPDDFTIDYIYNEKNQLAGFYGYEWSLSFIYDMQGRLVKMHEDAEGDIIETYYEYSEDGLLAKSTVVYNGMNQTVSEYSNYLFDEPGNWTSRDVLVKSFEGDESSITEERTIQYYE